MLHFLNRPDILLYGDLTVRMALRDLYNLSSKLHGNVAAGEGKGWGGSYG